MEERSKYEKLSKFYGNYRKHIYDIRIGKIIFWWNFKAQTIKEMIDILKLEFFILKDTIENGKTWLGEHICHLDKWLRISMENMGLI